MRQVQVTLRSGYLARNTMLRVGKTANGRRWEIQAYDGNGSFTTNITVDGKALPDFTTQREAIALLETLPQGPFWATSDRATSHYVQPSNTDTGYSILASMA